MAAYCESLLSSSERLQSVHVCVGMSVCGSVVALSVCTLAWARPCACWYVLVSVCTYLCMHVRVPVCVVCLCVSVRMAALYLCMCVCKTVTYVCVCGCGCVCMWV